MVCRFHVKHIRVSRRRRPRSTWVATPDVPLRRSGRPPLLRTSCRRHRRSEPGRSTAGVGCPRRLCRRRLCPRRLYRPRLYRRRLCPRRPCPGRWVLPPSPRRRSLQSRPTLRLRAVSERQAAQWRRTPVRRRTPVQRRWRCRRLPVRQSGPGVPRTGHSVAHRSRCRHTCRSRPVSRTSGWTAGGTVVRVRFVRRETGEHPRSSGRRRRRDRFPSPILRRAT
jgi:hypothetical protein